MEGQVIRTIRDFLTTKDGELCVNRDEYLQVNIKYHIITVQQEPQNKVATFSLNYCQFTLNIFR